MNYIAEMEKAMLLLKQLREATSKKEKLAAAEEMKKNEFGEKLVALLKDESIKVANFKADAATVQNEGRIRLLNFLNFNTGIEKSGKKLEASVFGYILRNADQEESAMYEAILTKSVSIPSIKEAAPKKVAEKKVKAEAESPAVEEKE